MRIRNKLLISYFVILISISGVLIAAYVISRDIIKSEVTENSINSLRVTSQQIDNDITYVINLWNIIYNSSNVNYYIQKFDLEEEIYPKHYAYVKLHDILNEYTSTFLQNNKSYELIVYTSSNELAYYSWEKKPPLINEIISNNNIPNTEKAFSASIRLSYNQNTPNLQCLYLYKTFTNVYDQSVDYHVVVGIPIKDISYYYESSYNDGSEISVIDENGLQIIGELKDKDLMEMSDNISQKLVSGSFNSKSSGEEYINIYTQMPSIKWYIIQSTPISKILGKLNIWRNIVLIGILLISGIVIIISLLINHSIVEPIQMLYKDMTKIIEGNIDIKQKNITDKSELGILSQQFYTMVKHTEVLQNRALENERQKHLLEIDALQTQINPHFMHNTINSIKILIQMQQYEKANISLSSLREILKNTLGKACYTTTLENEVDILKNYVYINKVRYTEFEFSVLLPDHLKNKKILRFIIQPFVENAIFHAYGEISSGDHIQVFFYDVVDEQALYVIIKDNGMGMSDEKIKEILSGDSTKERLNGIGINNIIERIALNYGEDYYVEFDSTPCVGTTVTIRLPLIGDEEDGAI